jgi:hypothetical protein
MRPYLSSHRESFIILASIVALTMTLLNYALSQRKNASMSYQQLARIKLEGDPRVNRVSVDRQGNMYIVTHTDQTGSLLSKFTPSGRHLQTLSLQQLLPTPRGSIHDLFMTREGTLYLLTVWRPPDGTEPVTGVLVLDSNGNLQRVVEIAPIFFRPGNRLAVDSTGAFYVSGLYLRERNPKLPLLTNNTIHKFSPSGELVTSFAPLTEQFTRERCENPRGYQALHIDSKDRLHQIFLDGTEVRTFDTGGRLLGAHRIGFNARLTSKQNDLGVALAQRRVLGSFVWNDHLMLAVGDTYKTADGVPAPSPEFYTLVLDPWEHREEILATPPGAIPVPTTSIGLDGYCYAPVHEHDPRTGAEYSVIIKQKLIMH